MDISARLPLADGRSIPQLGFGLYKVPDADAPAVVRNALDAGFRHLDDAALYGNETGVGRGIREGGVARDELFVTTKLHNDDHGFDATLRAFDASLGRLGLEEVDLYLIHWPVPSRDLYAESWRALVRIHGDGRVHSIGVSNFHPPQLERIIGETGVVPVVNQVELHPWLAQHGLRAWNASHGILTEAWSPLARGRAAADPLLTEIGARHGASPVQVAIRWHLQQGRIVIPKSVTPERIRANADVFGFELTPEEISRIDSLDAGFRTGRDPELD